MKTISVEKIIELESGLGNGIDCLDIDDLAKSYNLVEVETSSIKILDSLTAPLTIDNFGELYDGVIVGDEKYDDSRDVEVISRLIKMYESGEYVNPILLDKDGFVADGHHRLAALNTIGVKKTLVYKSAEK